MALLVGAVLNAPGIYKSAQIQPEGWKRDLALGVTEPLDAVSAALLLDRPRRGLKAVLGRSDDDEIDTAIALPDRPEQPGGKPPPPPAPKKFSPARPLRLWIAGDSLVVVPGESLLRAVAGNRAIERAADVDGRIASGLERPDVFNWFVHARQVLERKRPHAAVVMFGGNDDHGFMTGLPEGVSISSFGSSSWAAEYRRRVAGLMETITRRGAYLVWIGLPVTKDVEQTRRYDAINAIVQSEATRRKGRVSYLDTYFFFAGADGGYSQYVRDSSGKLVKMRADDGVHFERAAGDLIADKILELFDEPFDLTSWRQRPPATESG